MKYYVYNQQICVASFEAGSLSAASAQCDKLGIKHDAISSVYIPEPRSPGEVLDDTIANVATGTKTAVTKVRSVLSSLFGSASKAIDPNKPSTPVAG